MDVLFENLKRDLERAVKNLQSGERDAKESAIHREKLIDVTKSSECVVAERGGEQAGNGANEIAALRSDAELTVQNLQLGAAGSEAEKNQSCPSEVESETAPTPPLEIPVFSGQPFEFHKFMCIFGRKVDRQTSLSNVEKMMLLKNSLGEEALAIVDEIPITPASYPLALKLLEDVYEDKKRCVTSLYEHLVAIPVAAEDELSAFRLTYWKMEAILRSLELYDAQVDGNTSLLRLYLRKFPEEVRKVFLGEPNARLSEIRKRIHDIVYEKEQESVFSKFESEVTAVENGGVKGPSVSLMSATEENTHRIVPSLSTNEDFSLKEEIPCIGEYTERTALMEVINPVNDRKIQIRLVVAPFCTHLSGFTGNLLAERVAECLEIEVPEERSLECEDLLGNPVFASDETVEVLIQTSNDKRESIEVHIVEDNWSKNMYAPSLAEFYKVHSSAPADLHILDPGKGRLVELMVGDDSYNEFSVSYDDPDMELAKGWAFDPCGLGNFIHRELPLSKGG